MDYGTSHDAKLGQSTEVAKCGLATATLRQRPPAAATIVYLAFPKADVKRPDTFSCLLVVLGGDKAVNEVTRTNPLKKWDEKNIDYDFYWRSRFDLTPYVTTELKDVWFSASVVNAAGV